MTITKLYITTVALITLGFASCKKDDKNDSAEDNLRNTSWVAIMTDANPSTNPPGEFGVNGNNQYYPWQDCHMDDTFSFSGDQLTINDNNTICENGLDLIFEKKNQTYSYNPTTKKLTIGSGENITVLDVYELNRDRMKLGISVVGYGGGNNIVFLFKRK